MTQYHQCKRQIDGQDIPFPNDGVMTCGSCGKSWVPDLRPHPGQPCPTGNGAENTVSNPIIEPGIHGVTDEFVRARYRQRAGEHHRVAKEQTVGTIRALQQQAQPPGVRDVLVGRANEYPLAADHIADVLRAADLPELVANAEVAAEVSRPGHHRDDSHTQGQDRFRRAARPVCEGGTAARRV